MEKQMKGNARTNADKIKTDGNGEGKGYFDSIAQKVALIAGSHLSFITAALIVIVWGVTGPVFGYSDTWQLVINTGTTIITFLMVFLIQNTQNRDTRAMQLKLDELLRATKGARSTLIDLEDRSEEELEQLHNAFVKLALKTAKHPEEYREEK